LITPAPAPAAAGASAEPAVTADKIRTVERLT
jgi:hypothetical protein